MVFDLLLFSLCLFRPHCLTHTRGCHLWRLKFRSVLSLKYVYHPLSLTSILWVRFFSRPSYADRKWKKTCRNTFSLLYLRKSLQWNEILKYGRNTFQPVWLNTIIATLPSKLTCLVLLLIHSFECSSINPIKDFHQITLFFVLLWHEGCLPADHLIPYLNSLQSLLLFCNKINGFGLHG